MTISNVIIGLGIFASHGGVEISAEHDVIYTGQAAGEPLSDQEISELTAAGWWRSDQHCDCPYNEVTEKVHRSDCSQWGAFV